MNSTLEKLTEIYQYREGDDVMRRHREAQHCLDLEDKLSLGVALYKDLKRHNSHWADSVERGEIPFNATMAQRFASLFQVWRETTKRWLAIARIFRREYDVEHFDELFQLYNEIRTVNLDVAGLIEAYEKLESAGGPDVDEFFDELQNRDRSGCV